MDEFTEEAATETPQDTEPEPGAWSDDSITIYNLKDHHDWPSLSDATDKLDPNDISELSHLPMGYIWQIDDMANMIGKGWLAIVPCHCGRLPYDWHWSVITKPYPKNHFGALKRRLNERWHNIRYQAIETLAMPDAPFPEIFPRKELEPGLLPVCYDAGKAIEWAQFEG